jgi:Cdc6-like AAA superfamily ATPase
MVAMVTAVEPDVDIAEMSFDAYVTKALDRETVCETIERLVARAEYDDLLQEHYAVAEKLATIEGRTTRDERRSSEAYRELSERLRTLDEQLSAQAGALDRDGLVGSLDDYAAVDLEPTTDGGDDDANKADDDAGELTDDAGETT